MNKKNLPNNIPIFPLSNAVFFPRTILPLNIFEERYIQLVNDSMRDQRMFGMVQPKSKNSKKPEVYKVGCLGKIVSFNETADKRFIIGLSGISRFKIKDELDTEKLYRKFNVDYSDFLEDLESKKNSINEIDKKNLLNKIKLYFNKMNYSFDFKELLKLDFEQLINTVCMISHFSIEEKQKLVETIKIEDKVILLKEIINFNLVDIKESKTIQ